MTDGGYLGDITQITGWQTVQTEYEMTTDTLTVRSTGNHAIFYNNSIPVEGGSRFLIEGYIVRGGADSWIASQEIVYLKDHMVDDTHFSLELKASVSGKATSIQIQVRGDEPEDTEIVFTKIYLE